MSRLIDADLLKSTINIDGEPDVNVLFWEKTLNEWIDNQPTVHAVPIEVLYDLRDELQKEADRQSLITASDLNIAINRIDAKIRQYEGSDAE